MLAFSKRRVRPLLSETGEMSHCSFYPRCGSSSAFSRQFRDHGKHNGGVFARMFAHSGVIPRQASAEGLQQIGRVERLGGMFKAVSKRQIREPLVTGLKDNQDRCS